MKIQVLDKAKKKKFVEGLSGLGIKKIPQMLVRSGTDRIRAFSGDLDREAIMDLWHILPIEGVGLYVGKDMMNRSGVREVRLSLDGMHLWKDQLTKRILVLTPGQEVEWFLGRDVELDEDQKIDAGFVSVKGGDDFVGVGKIGADGLKLFGFLPKERRRKERM
jgi:NOL1/NOP2/fmu family ribosome biogenesis protein